MKYEACFFKYVWFWNAATVALWLIFATYALCTYICQEEAKIPLWKHWTVVCEHLKCLHRLRIPLTAKYNSMIHFLSANGMKLVEIYGENIMSDGMVRNFKEGCMIFHNMEWSRQLSDITEDLVQEVDKKSERWQMLYDLIIIRWVS